MINRSKSVSAGRLPWKVALSAGRLRELVDMVPNLTSGGPEQRQARASAVARTLLRWTARAAGLLLLLLLTWQQLMQFRAQPVSSTVVRQQAPFPRLTICPAASLTDYSLLLNRKQRLVNGSLSIVEYYNETTLEMVGREAGLLLLPGTEYIEFIPEDSPLGVWKQRYYLFQESVKSRKEAGKPGNGFQPTRCLTFQASRFLEELSGNELEMGLYLQASPLFTTNTSTSHRLFVHGAEEPNVDDLDTNQHGVAVPTTVSLELRPGQPISKYRVTARMRHLANLYRRPCRSEPGYSPAQCLKECLWRRLADHIGCRLPHMVSADVYLPEMRGPLDHLPLCHRPVQRVKEGKYFKPSEIICKNRFRMRGGNFSQNCLQQSCGLTRPAICGAELSQGDWPKLNDRNRTTPLHGLTGPLCPLPDEAEVYVPLDLLTNLTDCNCLPACRQVEYRLQKIKQTDEEDQCVAGAVLQFDLASQELQESLFFTYSTLLANLGGFIGLITGFSYFTLIEATETMLTTAARQWQTRRRLQADRQHHGHAGNDRETEARVATVGLAW